MQEQGIVQPDGAGLGRLQRVREGGARLDRRQRTHHAAQRVRNRTTRCARCDPARARRGNARRRVLVRAAGRPAGRHVPRWRRLLSAVRRDGALRLARRPHRAPRDAGSGIGSCTVALDGRTVARGAATGAVSLQAQLPPCADAGRLLRWPWREGASCKTGRRCGSGRSSPGFGCGLPSARTGSGYSPGRRSAGCSQRSGGAFALASLEFHHVISPSTSEEFGIVLVLYCMGFGALFAYTVRPAPDR